jgi:hypothetical protein
MPHFMMDCYYRSSPTAQPVLRESQTIIAPAPMVAVEEAHRRAERLRPHYFEIRDLSRPDGLIYNSEVDQHGA